MITSYAAKGGKKCIDVVLAAKAAGSWIAAK